VTPLCRQGGLTVHLRLGSPFPELPCIRTLALVRPSCTGPLNSFQTAPLVMLIKTSYRDVPTTANGRAGSIRIYIVEPNVPEYPEAKFPGCVVFSEIYQVTGPVERYVNLQPTLSMPLVLSGRSSVSVTALTG